MNRSGQRRGPLLTRIAPFAVALIVAAALIAFILRALLGALGTTRSHRAAGSDPQFAQSADTVTRPPELNESGAPVDALDDPSAAWELGEQTPVDKTAGELAREAESAG